MMCCPTTMVTCRQPVIQYSFDVIPGPSPQKYWLFRGGQKLKVLIFKFPGAGAKLIYIYVISALCANTNRIKAAKIQIAIIFLAWIFCHADSLCILTLANNDTQEIPTDEFDHAPSIAIAGTTVR